MLRVNNLSGFAVRKKIESGSESPGFPSSYLVEEDFESAGIPAGWDFAGTADFDYTSAPLVGSKSLQLPNAEDEADSPIFAAQSDLWIFYALKVAVVEDNGIFFILANDITADTCFILKLTASGQLQILGSSSELKQSSSAGLISAGTTYYIWSHYIKGTGSDGTVEIYVSTTTTKPGSPTFFTSSNTGIVDGSIFVFYTPASSAQPIVDYVRIDNVDIGSSPS